MLDMVNFLSLFNVYLRKLNDYLTKSTFFPLIPFIINLEYNNAVLLLFLGLNAGIYGIISFRPVLFDIETIFSLSF
jgi:hypothetical protein